MAGMQVYFKTNKYFIREKPNLSNYVRDLYHIPGEAIHRFAAEQVSYHCSSIVGVVLHAGGVGCAASKAWLHTLQRS